MSWLHFYIIFFALVELSVSLDVFNPKCTKPEESVNFVTPADTRGTLDILLVTLPTLFVCTWTVQHLNIPPKRSLLPHASVKERIHEFIQESSPKVLWMLVTIIAPEIIIALAFQDWILARRFFKILESIGDRQDKTWKKTHVLFANMGGFVLTLQLLKENSLFYDNEEMLARLKRVSKIEKELHKFSDTMTSSVRRRLKSLLSKGGREVPAQAIPKIGQLSDHQEPEEDDARREPDDVPKSDQSPSSPQSIHPQIYSSEVQITQSILPDTGSSHDVDEIRPVDGLHRRIAFANTRTEQAIRNTSGNEATASRDVEIEEVTLYLDAIQLYVALELGLIKELPFIEERKILDKSKSDNLLKMYAIVQITIFLARIITRYAKRLAISQLEMAVLAFCVCCCLAHGFYWSKPQSVMVPEDCPKMDYDGGNAPRRAMEVDLEVLKFFGSIDFIKTTFVPPFYTRRREPTSPIPNDAMNGILFVGGGVATHYAEAAAVLAGVAFGALYFMAWSFPFPSRPEMIIWMVSSGLTAAGPIIYDIANIIMTRVDRGTSHTRHALILYGIAIFYLGARLFLIVEMFRTLFYLPPSTFAS